MYKVVLLVAALTGCYSPSYSNCKISCTDSCPNSLTCDSQTHTCRAPGTTCSGGDAGGDTGGPGGDANRMDAMHDAPLDAAGGCTFVQEVAGSLAGPNLVIDLGSMPIAQGDFVALAIAGRGPGTLGTVNDFSGHQFLQAIKSEVTAGGTSTTSAIYYMLAAPAAMQMVNVSWTANVTQAVVGGEWHCGAPPSALSRTGMTSGASAGASTDTGAFTPPSRALVIASLASETNLVSLQTQGFTLLDQTGLSGGGENITNTTVRGVVEAGTNVDVMFSTATGLSFAGTAAAFTVQ